MLFFFSFFFSLEMQLLSILFRSYKALTFHGPDCCSFFVFYVLQLVCFVTLYLKEKKKTTTDLLEYLCL